MIDRLERPTRYDRPLTARLSREQVRALADLAHRQRRPVSELLREAVDALLAAEARAAG